MVSKIFTRDGPSIRNSQYLIDVSTLLALNPTDLKVITGDFNGDNNTDISIFAKNAQGGDWMTAYSAGNGSWRIGKKHTRKHFDDWSFTSGVFEV